MGYCSSNNSISVSRKNNVQRRKYVKGEYTRIREERLRKERQEELREQRRALREAAKVKGCRKYFVNDNPEKISNISQDYEFLGLSREDVGEEIIRIGNLDEVDSTDTASLCDYLSM